MKYEYYLKKQLVFSCESKEEKQRFELSHVRYDTLETTGKQLHFEDKMGTQKNVVDFAYEIIDMQKSITWLEKENQRLKEFEVKYNKLLDSSVEHSNIMLANVLKANLAIKR